MRHLAASSCVSVLCGVMTACGGAGDDSNGPIVTDANVVDVSLVAALGVQRAEHAIDLVQLGFRLAADGALASKTLACPDGGGIVYENLRNNAHRFTADQCVLALDTQNNPALVALSGIWQSNNATVGGSGPGGGFLAAGTVTFSGVAFGVGEGQLLSMPSAPAGLELTAGSLTASLSNVDTGTWAGSLDISRNGRTDRYTNIALTAALPTGTRTADLSAASYAVSSQRLGGELEVAWNFSTQPIAQAQASDGTAARFSFRIGNSGGVDISRFERFSSPGTGATSTQELSHLSPQVTAAASRVLQ